MVLWAWDEYDHRAAPPPAPPPPRPPQEHVDLLHSANEMKRTYEEQLQQQRTSSRLTVEALKAEISSKEEQITQITE